MTETKSKFEGGQVQDVRVYLRELSTGEARSLPDEQNLRAAFAVMAEKRSSPQATPTPRTATAQGTASASSTRP